MLLIYPPITPYSSAPRIREWIEELEGMRADSVDDREDMQTIEHYLLTAREWLEATEAHSTSKDESAA